jgi:membrane-associated phospholipid phosphatase
MILTNISDLVNRIVDLLYAIGFFSELIVIIMIIYLLYDRLFDLTFFILGIFSSLIINQLLKGVFRDPRPSNPIKFLNNEQFPKKLSGKNFNIFGMPSGHAQNVSFALAYLYWTIPENFIMKFISIFIGVVTIFQRWWFKNHTLPQLFVGVIVGITFAYFTIQIRKKCMEYYKSKKCSKCHKNNKSK